MLEQPVIPSDVSYFFCVHIFISVHVLLIPLPSLVGSKTMVTRAFLQHYKSYLSPKKTSYKRPSTTHSWWAGYPSVIMSWVYELMLLFTAQTEVGEKILKADSMIDLHLPCSVTWNVIVPIDIWWTDLERSEVKLPRKCAMKEQSQKIRMHL